MFSLGRYVAIDDKEEHLAPLIKVLHDMGAPCIGIHYQDEVGLGERKLEGLRVLFMDLHLHGKTESEKTTYARISQLLESLTTPSTGPYLLILWTQHLEELKGCTEYIFKTVKPEHLPVNVLGLDKDKYIAANNANKFDLQVDIVEKISETPQISAILNWEKTVLLAANATLSQVNSLIPPENRNITDYPNALDKVLSLLAVESYGKEHAQHSPKMAVSAALSPILIDKIDSAPASTEEQDIWKRAVTNFDEHQKVDTTTAAQMNTMCHIVLPSSESIRPFDWGAVISLPNNFDNAENFKNFFGFTPEDLKKELRAHPDKLDECRLCLVRVGAVCDFRLSKPGPAIHILAMLRPIAAINKSKKKGDYEENSMTLFMDEIGSEFELAVNARIQLSLTEAETKDCKVHFRAREQLLNLLATHCANYTIRPGALSFAK